MPSVFLILFFDQNLGQEFVSLVFHLHGSFEQRTADIWQEQTQWPTVSWSAVHFLELDARCRCFDPPPVSPRCAAHDDDHDGQSHTEHDAADGQVDGTADVSWRNQISGSIFKQKPGCEGLKHRPDVSFGGHLTPPRPVVVFPPEVCHQGDVAARATNQLVPASDHTAVSQLMFHILSLLLSLST